MIDNKSIVNFFVCDMGSCVGSEGIQRNKAVVAASQKKCISIDLQLYHIAAIQDAAVAVNIQPREKCNLSQELAKQFWNITWSK